MNHYKYLMVGGGMTAHAAVKGIRELDADGAIGLVSSDPHPPYKRPPLSKKLWKGAAEDTVWLDMASLGVTSHLAHTVAKVDLAAKEAIDDSGSKHSFEKLLLATGGSPKTLPLRTTSSTSAPSTTTAACEKWRSLAATS